MQQEEKQMPTFLEDITPFYGTHDKNPAGQTLEDFLEDYDPYKYENQAVQRMRLYFLTTVRCRNPSKGSRS